jgi:hypothetical protein
MDNEQTVDDVASMGEDDSSTMLQDFIKYGAYAPIDDGVQEFADGGEVVGDPLFDDLQKRQAAANAYSNPIINQPAVGPDAVAKTGIAVTDTLKTPVLPSALTTLQQPLAAPATGDLSVIKPQAATSLSAADMLTNIPTFASTTLTLPEKKFDATPTLTKPVLKELKDLPAQQINLAPSDILTSYGTKTTGEATTKTEPTVVSFDRPQDFAAYLTPDGIQRDTGGGGGGTTGGGGGSTSSVLRTPGGYEYTNYATFNPENISGTKAQVTSLFGEIAKQQQSEVDAIRGEYTKAVSTGNWDLAGKLNALLLEQEGDVTRSKTDFTAASKYFTGVGGAYELPTGYQTRREGDWFKNKGITGYTGSDIGAIGFTPETKAGVDPFTQALTTQRTEYDIANTIYGELSKQFGANSDIAKNYLSNVVTPQKEQYDQINKMSGDYTKSNLYGTISGAAAYKDYSPLKLAEIRNEAQTTNWFKPTIDLYQGNVTKLTNARNEADRLGLSGYASKLNSLLDTEQERLNQATGARQSAIDQAQPDPMRDLILGKQMAAQKITSFAGMDLPDNLDYSKVNAFNPLITRQNQDYLAANATYGQLVTLYGDKADITRNFFNDVVTPQKQELAQATSMRDNANTSLTYINKPYSAYTTPKLTITAKTTEDNVRDAFKTAYGAIDKNVGELDLAIQNFGDKTGVGYYSDALRDKKSREESKRGLIENDINMYINKIPGRAKGSPPEGEISNPVARMVERQSRSKDQGMDSKSKAMLKKFAGGGEAVASSSPTSQEFPLNEKLYATGEARSLESTELPLIGKVARFIQSEERKPTARRNPREDITKTDMGADAGVAMDWIADKLFQRTAIGKTAENVAQGLPTTQGKGVVRYLNPDAKEALMGVAGLVTPAGAKAAKEGVDIVAQGAKKAGKKALKELGPTAARMMEKQMEPYNLYAVKPDGGTFFPEGSNSGIDEYLDRVVKYLPTTQGAATVAGKDMADVAEFIRKKGRKYFTSEYGTADDTLRTAAMDGRLPLYNEDKEYFRGYALKAARDDSAPGGILNQDAVEARMDLENLYDRKTGMSPFAFSGTDDALNRMNVRDSVTDKVKEKMLEQGVLPDHVNIPGVQLYKPSDLSLSYTPDPVKQILSYRQGQGDIDKSLQYALKNEEPIYDLSHSPSLGFLNDRNVAEGIMTIPAKERNNMSFPEAIIKGEKNLKFEKDWQLVIAQARKGKPLPKKTYMEGTEPLYNVNDKSEWVRVVTPNAVELEGAAMGHSVGDYKTKLDYGQGGKEAFKNGTARVFSLRNDKGVPSLTVETSFKNDEYKIHQVKSVFNSEPSTAEKKIIFELFDKLRPTRVHTYEKYYKTRAGEDIPSDDQIKLDWSNLYNDYKLYKNKDGE